MKFDNVQDFLEELDKQLQQRVEKLGRIQDLQRVKIELCIERFLSRIGPDLGAVKGGTAAMLTVPDSPHTSDVDIVISEALVKSHGLADMDPKKRADALAELVQEHLQKGHKKDFFRFKYEDAFEITDLKPGHACAKILYTVMVGKSELHQLEVAVALQVGDLPSEIKPARNMLAFAGVENPEIRIVTPEYLFADKVTLYLEEHGSEDAERVKDIVHAALVAEKIKFDTEKLAQVMADRAVHREVVDKLEKKVPDPPKRWKEQFKELREQAGSAMTMSDAIEIIESTVSKVREKAVECARAKQKSEMRSWSSSPE